jgi:hypothetical protein
MGPRRAEGEAGLAAGEPAGPKNVVWAEFSPVFRFEPGLTESVITILVTVSPFW